MHWQYGGMALLAITLGALIFFMRGQYNSPDERANDLFARTWAHEGVLSYPAAVQNAGLSYPLFPRSTQPVGELLRPVGFIGMPLVLGTLARIFGDGALPYITLIVFFLGAGAWWFITHRVFGKEIADVSVWLYLLHPALVYYSVRGLYPNMMLLCMVLIAVACAMRAYEIWKKRGGIVWQFFVWCAAAGFATMIALLVRPPEALVMFGLVASAAMVFGEKKVRRVGATIILALCAIALLGWFARRVGALSGAYPFLRDSSLFGILFPFGIDVGLIWHNCIHFIVRLFWPWVLLSTAGVLWWAYEAYRTRTWPRMILAYLWVVVPASLWLFAAYGSWRINDNPADPHAVTIGISYVRYWLPHFLFRMPFAVILVFALRERFFPYWSKQKVAAILVLTLGLFGAWRMWSGVDGMGAVLKENQEAKKVVAEVVQMMPPHGVLAVRAWDKHFFPLVPVLQPFPKELHTFTAVHELRKKNIPVLAFIAALNETDVWWLATNGLHAREIKKFGSHILYEITE